MNSNMMMERKTREGRKRTEERGTSKDSESQGGRKTERNEEYRREKDKGNSRKVRG